MGNSYYYTDEYGNEMLLTEQEAEELLAYLEAHDQRMASGRTKNKLISGAKIGARIVLGGAAWSIGLPWLS